MVFCISRTKSLKSFVPNPCGCSEEVGVAFLGRSPCSPTLQQGDGRKQRGLSASHITRTPAHTLGLQHLGRPGAGTAGRLWGCPHLGPRTCPEVWTVQPPGRQYLSVLPGLASVVGSSSR